MKGCTYTYQYNEKGRTIECTEPNGNKTMFRYTSDYRIESVEDLEGVVKYNYEKDSKESLVTDKKTSDLKGYALGQTESIEPHSGLKLQTFNMNVCTGDMKYNTLFPQFRIFNTGGGDIDLSDITLRYYYTIDGEAPQNFWCDWSSIGSSNVTGRFVKLKNPVVGADYYLEVGFTANAGKLLPEEPVDLHTRIGKKNWEDFIPGDDYSQNTASALCEFENVDMFYQGNLVWGKGIISGEEEDGSSGGDVEEPDDGNPDDGNPDDGKPDDGKPDDGKPDDGKPDDGKPDDGKPDDGKPDDGKPDDGKPDDGKPDDGKPDDSQGSDEESSEEEIIIPQGLNRLKLKMYNNGNNGSFAKVIYPMMKLVNLGENMVKLSNVKIRYYYTADDEKPQNFWCDWSEAGSNAVTGTFHTMEETWDGADSYLEIGFTEEAGYIDIGASIHLNVRFAKEDWSNYDLTNDHSILPGSDYKDWEKVDIFLEDTKIWGEDLVEEAEPLEEGDMEYADDTYTPVRVQMYNQNRESRCNQIAFKFRIYNTQSDPIALSDLRFNYFYTTDGPEQQMFEPDWVGVSNASVPFIPTSDITCNITAVDDSNTTTKCVADIGFTREDVFIDAGDYVEVQVRIHRPEWTKYVQTNDYSFDAERKEYEDTNKVAVFVKDRWAYGSIPLSYTDMVDLGEEEEPETKYEQDSMKGPTSETDKAGNVSKYTYDKNGTVTAVVDPLGNQTVFTYNKWNQITSTTDALGNTTTYEYDNKGNLLSVRDALGTTTNYTYNEKGQPIKVVRADGTIETNTYDSRGNVIQETDGTGATIQYTYDAFNRVIQKTDATGGITRYEYSPSGNVIKETDPLGYTYVTTYNKDGSILAETDWNKNVTKYQYEKTTGRLKQVIYANAGSETYAYNEMGEISSVTGPDGGTVQYVYDKLGRLIAEVNELGGKTVYTYDCNGNLITEENPEGRTTSYSYDKLNRVIAYTDEDGYKMETKYDPAGRMIMETDGLGASVHYIYDKLGQLIKTKDAFGNTILYEYDKLGNPIGITDAEGNKTQYQYDAQGRKTKETNALGVVSSWSYDKNGNLIDYTDGRGNRTSYRYDKKNQMLSKLDADGNETRYEYDGCGNLLAETDPLKRRTVYQYDALGNLIKRTNPAGKTIQWEYSLGGLLTKETDAKGNQVSYQYDKGGNQISRTSPNGAITRYAYDKLGRLIQETDALGNQTCYDYDGRGNQIQKTDALGNKKQYVYDGASQLTQVKDELGNHTVYEYDKVGNLIRQTRMGKNAETDQTTRFWYNKVGQFVKTVDPLGERVLYAYDAEGQLIQETAEDDTMIHYQYDKTGNLKKVTYSDGRSVVFEYTALGQRKTRTDWTGVTSYEYDAGGQLRKTTDSNGRTLEYDWTELGQKQAIHYSDGNIVQYAYDDNANLTKVTDLDGGVTTYEYDEENQRIAKRLPNGATSLYEYDPIGRLIKREEIGKRGTNRYEYAYDKVGNRVKEKRSNTQGSTHENQEEISYFTYDATGQLTEVSDSNGKRSYTYDSFQNRLKKEEVGKETIEYVYNDRNQLLLAVQNGNEFLYQYDPRGNLKEVKENGIIKQTYTFDSTNLLSKAIVYQNGTENTVVQYTYDGVGIRVGKKVEEEGKTVVDTSYVSDLESPYQNLLMEEDRISGKTTLFTFAEEPVSMHTDGATSYYRCDEKQSVEEELDPTGYIQRVISYDEFGMIQNQEDIKAGEPGFAYTGYMLEEQTGLSYAKARYYDAENGRFISEDGYLGNHREATELNRYTYARNNPIRYRDPSGKFVIAATLTVSATSVLVNALVDLAVTAVVVKVGYDIITETNNRINTINTIKPGEKRNNGKTGQKFKGKGKSKEKSGDEEYKNRKKVKGKQKDDIPDRFKGEKPYKGESGKEAAKRVLQEYEEYDPKDTGPTSIFNKLKKHFDYDFE